MGRRYLTTRQVAAAYGVTEETVRRARRAGKLRAALRLGGYRYDAEDVARWAKVTLGMRADAATDAAADGEPAVARAACSTE